MTHKVELLWFSDCPNHPAARVILERVIAELAPGTPIVEIDATDPARAASLRFPGSPTIRIDGLDVDPGYVDPGDYTPRCRLYRTSDGLRGLPERAWIEDALGRGDASRHVADGAQRERESELISHDNGRALGDSIAGAVIVAGGACCVVAFAAAVGIGLPLVGAVAGGAAVIGGVVAGRRSVRTARK